MTARNLIPGFRYADAPAAITFLCEAFGFTRHAVYADQTDPTLILHAELVLDDAMIMIGSSRPGEAQTRYGWKTAA